jgi:hypothetical protein
MTGIEIRHRQVAFEAAALDVVEGTVIHPGKGHDRVLCRDGFLGVADGATPLIATWPDAGAFAALALAELARSAGIAAGRDMWSAAMVAAARRSSARAPVVSCSVAVVRAVGRVTELAVLGDCTAIVETSTGKRAQVHDDTPRRLDAAVARSAPAGRQAALLHNRQAMNSPGGYWIFSTDPAAAEHVRVARLATDAVRTVLLFTDGVAPTAAAEDRPEQARADVERLVRGDLGPVARPDDAGFVLARRRQTD